MSTASKTDWGTILTGAGSIVGGFASIFGKKTPAPVTARAVYTPPPPVQKGFLESNLLYIIGGLGVAGIAGVLLIKGVK